MCTLPRTRKSPAARKYFATLLSCAPSSCGEYGVSRTGGARPGTNFAIAVLYLAWTLTVYFLEIHRLAEAGLQEVHRQRPGEVEDGNRSENQPRAPHRRARVANVLARVAVSEERTRRTRALLFGHQNTFSMISVSSGSTFATSASIRSRV